MSWKKLLISTTNALHAPQIQGADVQDIGRPGLSFFRASQKQPRRSPIYRDGVVFVCVCVFINQSAHPSIHQRIHLFFLSMRPGIRLDAPIAYEFGVKQP